MSSAPLDRLQLRVLGGPSLILADLREVKDLKSILRARITRAFEESVLVKDFAHLIWSRKLPRRGRSEDIAVWGGVEVNQKRDPHFPHFMRADGAWFDFHIELRRYAGDLGQYRGDLELLGYGYEIRFPLELGCGVSWLRFDLNPPGHHNEARNVRAHFHPGDEDLQAPSPVLHPEEALELLLSDLLRLPEKRRRAASAL